MRWAAGLTVAAGVVGWLTDRVTVNSGWSFPSTGYLVGELVWKTWTLAVLIWSIRRFGGNLKPESVGLRSESSEPRQRFPVALAALVAAGAFGLSITVGSSATVSSSFGPAHHVGIGLALGELAVRYPLTVFVEEAFFRGWLQPRLGRHGPAFSAILWGLYHLQQVRTIPSLILFGLALGLIRWRTGNVRVTGLLHYGANAVFFVGNYF